MSTLPTLLGLLRLRTIWAGDGRPSLGCSATGVPVLLRRAPELDDRLSFEAENALGSFDFGEGLRSSAVGPAPKGELPTFCEGVDNGDCSLALRACPLGGEVEPPREEGEKIREEVRFSAPADRGDGPGIMEWA